MRRSVAAEIVAAQVARVLHRSQDIVLQSQVLRLESRRLVRRSISLALEMRRLEDCAHDSIVHGFAVAREGRRIARKLRCPYASPIDGQQKVVGLARFRRPSSAA